MTCDDAGDLEGGRKGAPGRIVAVYAFFAGLWILFSDSALAFFLADPVAIAKISVFKGWFFVAVTSAMLYFLIKRHVGALMRSRDEADHSRRRFQALFEQAGDGIFLADAQTGRFLTANPAALAMLGYQAGELCALAVSDCLEPEERPRLVAMMEKLRSGESARGEWRLARKDGTGLVAEVTGRILHDGALLGIVRDVTVRRQAQEELSRSVREKEIMLREIHHRVKNNMQVIVSLLSLQAAEIADPKGLDAFRQTGARIRSMALIHEKLYSGGDFAEVDMQGYCRSLMLTLLAAAKPPGLAVEHELDIRLPSLPISQALPCGLLLNELLSNALKHAFVGRDAGRVAIVLRREGTEAVLAVADDGGGFAQNPLEGGGGLGYTLIRAWCEQLHATLGVAPGQDGRGSRVVVRFPLA
jgi:two-component system, sensor histidine kinase PdtaS